MFSFYSFFVISLVIVVGIEKGFNFIDFVIIIVFVLIIMYDVVGVRWVVGK